MKPAIEPIDVSTEELENLLEGVRAALGETGYQKLKAAIHTLGYVTELLENREATLQTLRRLLCQASTERTGKVLQQAGIETSEKNHKPAGQSLNETVPSGHGRNGAAAFTGAKKVAIPHPLLKPGDACPSCPKGKVYVQQEPKTLVRLVDKRRWRRPCTSVSVCVAMRAARYSARQSRKVWAQRSMTRARRR